MKTLFDSSFLILSAEIGRDLISLAEEILGEKIEPYILNETLEELKTIARHSGKRAASARAAVRIAEKMRVMRGVGEVGNVDEEMLETCAARGLVLATIDSELIKRAGERGVPILTIGKDFKPRFIGVRP